MDKSGYAFFFLVCIGLLLSSPIPCPPNEKPMVVVVPSYNNIRWCKKNLRSILNQNYGNYRVIYIDDASVDGTSEAVKKIVRARHAEPLVQLIVNKERLGALANLYHAIYSCKDDEIIVTVDGDDWLKHNDVLKNLNTV